MRRAVLVAAALALPISGATTVALAGDAGAAPRPTTAITCSAMFAGSVQFSFQFCRGGAAFLGNSSAATGSDPTGFFAFPSTLRWTVGGTIVGTTSISVGNVTSTSAKKCPGYVKGGTANPVAYKVSGTVTADSGNGIKVGKKYQGAWCQSSSDSNWAVLKPFVFA